MARALLTIALLLAAAVIGSALSWACYSWMIAHHWLELASLGARCTLLAALLATGAWSIALSKRPVRGKLALLATSATLPVVLLLAWGPVTLARSAPSPGAWDGILRPPFADRRELVVHRLWPTAGPRIPFVSDLLNAQPYFVVDRVNGSRYHVGMISTASHNTTGVQLAVDSSACRAFWLRMESSVGDFLDQLTSGAPPRRRGGRLLHRPARLVALDACRGDGAPTITPVQTTSMDAHVHPLSVERWLALHDSEHIKVLDTSTWQVVQSFELSGRERRGLIHEGFFADERDGNGLVLLRFDRFGWTLGTLWLDLDTGDTLELAVVDLSRIVEATPYSAAEILAIEGPADAMAVHLQIEAGRSHTALSAVLVLEPRTGTILFRIDDVEGPFESALFLHDGAIAITTSRGRLLIADRTGQIETTVLWKDAQDLETLWEIEPGTVALAYRDSSSRIRVDHFEVATRRRLPQTVGMPPVARTPGGWLAGQDGSLVQVSSQR